MRLSKMIQIAGIIAVCFLVFTVAAVFYSTNENKHAASARDARTRSLAAAD